MKTKAVALERPFGSPILTGPSRLDHYRMEGIATLLPFHSAESCWKKISVFREANQGQRHVCGDGADNMIIHQALDTDTTIGDEIITYYILKKKIKSCKRMALHYSN